MATPTLQVLGKVAATSVYRTQPQDSGKVAASSVYPTQSLLHHQQQRAQNQSQSHVKGQHQHHIPVGVGFLCIEGEKP